MAHDHRLISRSTEARRAPGVASRVPPRPAAGQIMRAWAPWDAEMRPTALLPVLDRPCPRAVAGDPVAHCPHHTT
ncbi:hypothetical protein AB0H82_31790 [Streptomyces sp. NPDC050732]|uniref:hypothetical protein n=1 Tax=Streptomyces sp. NPDC050732 TaxID=3154632 RepID=UPI0034145020